MDVVKQSKSDIISFLGGPQKRIKDKTYRLNKYCIEIPINDDTALYNGLTGSLVVLKKLERCNIFTTYPCDYVKFLLENFFLVSEEFDEDMLINSYRENHRPFINDTYLDVPNHYTILTTSKCNARCFYCYELGIKNKHNMTLETAEELSKYIIDRSIPNKPVTLDWFGGEPLFNYEVIDLITSRLASAGIKFTSTMISNGFLFDKDLVKKAKYQWNLQNVQITIDGTEEIYNKAKNYINPKTDSPFKKVIQNIKLLTEFEIKVSIRMNADLYNIEDLKKLIELLAIEFRGNKFFGMYVHEIFEINGYTRTEEQNNILFPKIIELEKILIEKGFLFPKLAYGIKSVHCKVDSGSGIVVTPDGGFGVCEHYPDSRCFSDLSNPTYKNYKELNSWRNYHIQDSGLCKDCVLKPTCLRMNNCPDSVICDKAQQLYHIEHMKLDILETIKEHYSHGNCQKK